MFVVIQEIRSSLCKDIIEPLLQLFNTFQTRVPRNNNTLLQLQRHVTQWASSRHPLTILQENTSELPCN